MNSNLTVTPQLIPVFLGQIGGISAYVCDARKLHAFLEVGKRFTSWIQERIEKYGFEENRDFVLVSQNRETKKGRGGDRRSKDYHLSLDMAKELSMVENNDQGRAARRYFIEMEKKALASAGQMVPPSHLETLLPSEQQTLAEIIHKKAEGYGEAQGKVLAEIWSRLHNKFRVAKYSQLPRTQLAEAILYVTDMDIRTLPYEAPRLSHTQRLELARAVSHALAGAHRECGEGGEQWVYNRLRVKLNLKHIEDMHPDQFPEALAELEQLKRDLSAYFSFRAELRECLCREIIGAGTPWTPNVARKWKAQLKEIVPERPDWLAMRVRLLKKK